IPRCGRRWRWACRTRGWASRWRRSCWWRQARRSTSTSAAGGSPRRVSPGSRRPNTSSSSTRSRCWPPANPTAPPSATAFPCHRYTVLCTYDRENGLEDGFAGFDAGAQQRREAVAVVDGVAERHLVELGALEEQMHVVLPREPDA